MTPDLSRRKLLLALALPGFAGCASPLPLNQSVNPATDGQKRLNDSALAHGLEAYRAITDINIGYDGQWRALIDRVQPEVVDAGYRGTAQDRLLPKAGVVAQAYRGTRGVKQVLWRRGNGDLGRGGSAGNVGSMAQPGSVQVWYDGGASVDEARRSAAAVVAEC